MLVPYRQGDKDNGGVKVEAGSREKCVYGTWGYYPGKP